MYRRVWGLLVVLVSCQIFQASAMMRTPKRVCATPPLFTIAVFDHHVPKIESVAEHAARVAQELSLMISGEYKDDNDEDGEFIIASQLKESQNNIRTLALYASADGLPLAPKDIKEITRLTEIRLLQGGAEVAIDPYYRAHFQLDAAGKRVYETKEQYQERLRAAITAHGYWDILHGTQGYKIIPGCRVDQIH